VNPSQMFSQQMSMLSLLAKQITEVAVTQPEADGTMLMPCSLVDLVVLALAKVVQRYLVLTDKE